MLAPFVGSNYPNATGHNDGKVELQVDATCNIT